ncbi:nitric oxide synthase oxygenase [Alteribacillus sp. HJP-4]|uniref:nitric oxide synthase oxygenase n=1 Tax=Alteribacillus sp. HJP-4 TaxID=2775394 RepID=UPI0035CCFF5F
MSDTEKMWREACSFLDMYYRENNLSKKEHALRLREIRHEITVSGYYEHTFEELSYGANKVMIYRKYMIISVYSVAKLTINIPSDRK